MTTFVNEKRQYGATVEGHGEYRTVWPDFEIKCPCGKWTRDYGNVSEQVGDDPDVQAWLCPACVKLSEFPDANEPMPVADALRNPAGFVAGMSESVVNTTAVLNPADQDFRLEQESAGKVRVSVQRWPNRNAAVAAFIDGRVKWEPWN